MMLEARLLNSAGTEILTALSFSSGAAVGTGSDSSIVVAATAAVAGERFELKSSELACPGALCTLFAAAAAVIVLRGYVLRVVVTLLTPFVTVTS